MLITVFGENVHESTWHTELWPVGGGPPIRIFSSGRLRWSLDRTRLFLSVGRPTERGASGVPGRTFVIPLPQGSLLPDISAPGFQWGDEIAKLPGVRVVASADATPGPTADIYSFSRESVQRNLYRIPLQE
jgi:hypothetical protein